MNKYEEALEIVECKMGVEDWFCEIEKRSSKECAKCDCTKAYETLKELVEKAKSKKVIKLKLEPSTNEEYETWWEEYEYRCPNCNYDLFANAENYCGNCGQAIDWSEEE